MFVFFVDSLLQFLAQDRHPLGQGIAILARLNGSDTRLFNRLGYVKVGLANREVDGIFQLGREVKDLANAATVKGFGTVGNPGMHGNSWGVKGI